MDKVLPAVGLDAGGETTRCVICLLEHSRLRLLGVGGAPSQGWVKSGIADQSAAAESMHKAVREAEHAAQISVESATVGVGGIRVRGGNSHDRLKLGRPREVRQSDVNRAIRLAARVQLLEDRMILQLFPQDFVVDDQPGHLDPRSMWASSIEANIHLISTSVAEHNCLVGAVNQAHLAVEDTVIEGLAACYAAVLPEERRDGIAVLDIGAQSTELVIFHGEAMQLASSVRICGDHFTGDVARALCISYEDAARLKEEYGCAVADATPRNVWVEVPSTNERSPREESRRLLNRILEARAQELFEHVLHELRRVHMHRCLLGGVVLTGAGARLDGICDMAERVLGCQARYGLAVGIQDWPKALEDPAWTTAAGLSMYSARLKMHGEIERQSIGVLGRILR